MSNRQDGQYIVLFGGAKLSKREAGKVGLGLACGFAGALSSLFFLGSLDQQTTLGIVVVALFIAGSGSGLTEVSNNSAIMGSAPEARLGTAAAAVAISRQLGLSLGISVGGAIFASRQRLYEATQTDTAAVVNAYQDSTPRPVIAAAHCGVRSLRCACRSRGRSVKVSRKSQSA